MKDVKESFFYPGITYYFPAFFLFSNILGSHICGSHVDGSHNTVSIAKIKG
jgi:hypothetical protein